MKCTTPLGRLAKFACSIAALGLVVSIAEGVPIWDGKVATTYATADNPFEIEFDIDGTLYAAHHSPSNGAAFLHQIPPGGGAALPWGSSAPEDPDGIDVFGGHVYASNEGAIWQATTPGGAMSVWATVSGSPNQSGNRGG